MTIYTTKELQAIMEELQSALTHLDKVRLLMRDENCKGFVKMCNQTSNYVSYYRTWYAEQYLEELERDKAETLGWMKQYNRTLKD